MAIQDISNLSISSSFQNLIQRSGSFVGTATGTQIDSLTITASLATTASFVVSASYADNASSASVATTATNADVATTASYVRVAQTASYVNEAQQNFDTVTYNNSNKTLTLTRTNGGTQSTVITSASFADTSISASRATSASRADSAASADLATTSSFTVSSSFADTATSASHAVQADNAQDANDLIVTVKNTSGGPIAKGNVLHATGVTGENINVELADNTTAASMPGFAIANEAISNNATGEAIISGKIININTSGLTAGSNVYVNASGGFTGTKPTGSALIQNIGVVGKVNASEGELIVLGSGRSNDVPNISENFLWVGNSDQVATPTDKDALTVGTASLALGMPSNTNLNINEITASAASFTSASIGYLESITGSAKIVGDAFIILNADTPTQRYAGLQVYDSGSTPPHSASFIFDGQNNDWFYEYSGSDDTDYGVFMVGPEYSTKGSPTYPSNNRLVKGDGGHHLNDSTISDDGTNVRVASNLIASGSHILQNAAVTPATILQVKDDNNNIIQVDNDALAAITGYNVILDGNSKVDGNLEITGDTLFTASLASTASYIAGANVDGAVTTANTASYVAGGNVDGAVASATSASYATSASIAEFEKNLNSSSGSIQLWQGSQTEYDAISGSASDSVLYFVV